MVENYQHEWLMWLICCLGGGIGAAMSLYYGLQRWKGIRLWILASLRALSFAVLLFLLIAPTFKKQNLHTEYPFFLVAWDNSSSMECCVDTLGLRRSLRSLRTELKQWSQTKDIKLRWYYMDQALGDAAEGLRFEATRSKIGGLINEMTTRHEGDHVAGLLLLSDGLQNQGPALEQIRTPYPLYVLGIGDTLTRRDLMLEQLLYNRMAYEDTELQIKALISQKGYTGTPIEVILEGPNREKYTQQLICSGARLETVSFSFPAPSAGSYRYRVRIRPVAEEQITENNEQSAFIKVLKDKLKVLILAPYPHPDISALRRSLALSTYYETEVFIQSRNQRLDKNIDYQLALFYDAFADARLLNTYQQLQDQGTPIWYFITPRTQRNLFGRWADTLGLSVGPRAALPRATVIATSSPPPFEDHVPFIDRLEVYPPLALPHFEVRPRHAHKSLLDQRREPTPQPLWWIKDDRAISLGADLWQWRLQEAKTYAAPSLFDQLVLGVAQHLSSKTKKRHFKVYPIDPLITTGDPALFRTEVYDANFIPRYGDLIKLTLKHKNTQHTKSYTYTHTQSQRLFRLKALDTGTYSYEATLNQASAPLYSRGQLYVEENKIEESKLQADFPLLRRLAAENQGHFYTLEDSTALLSALDAQSVHPRRYTQSEVHRLIAWPWILYFLLGLLLSEWGLRKYFGTI